MHRRISTTFRFNIKYSFIKLLCTLTRLCRVTPLQPIRLEFFGIDFPLYPCSQLPFITFHRQDNITKVKARRANECALIPNLPTPETSRPTPSPTYPSPRLDTLCASPFRIAARRCRILFLVFS